MEEREWFVYYSPHHLEVIDVRDEIRFAWYYVIRDDKKIFSGDLQYSKLYEYLRDLSRCNRYGIDWRFKKIDYTYIRPYNNHFECVVVATDIHSAMSEFMRILSLYFKKEDAYEKSSEIEDKFYRRLDREEEC